MHTRSESLDRGRMSPNDQPFEREVLELVGAGLSNAEIGGRLGLAEKTVKHYMTAILGKLQVGSRVEAALIAYKAGLGAGGSGSGPTDG